MTSTDETTPARQQREDFWAAIGTVGAARAPLGDLDEGPLWPKGESAYLVVTTPHAGIVATDGLGEAPADGTPGVELYVEGVELVEDAPDAGAWLVHALEETAGAVAAAGTSLGEALAEHDLLSVEVPGTRAPEEWLADGRLGVLIGVPLPGRATVLGGASDSDEDSDQESGPDSTTGESVSGEPVRILAVTPLRPEELAVVTAEGAVGRRRISEALAAAGWYSYADAERPAVL